MGKDKNIPPTIEESLRMIEEKLSKGEKNKKKTSNSATFNQNKKPSLKPSLLSGLLDKKKISKKNVKKKEKDDDVLLLTKKVNKNGEIIDLKTTKKVLPKSEKEITNKIEDDQYKKLDNNSSNKNLSKTGDLAVIINKLKEIRDKKINKKKHSKSINKEITKLNETILLAEELFKKELLNL